MWRKGLCVILFGISLATAYDENGSHCTSDSRCTCHNLSSGGIKANCYGLGLKSIPYFTDNVRVIDLRRNKIEEFQVNISFPKRLVSLILSHNQLNRLNNDPFRGLFHLTYLGLDNNQLRYHSSVFVKGLFRDLVNLQSLNIKQNTKFVKNSVDQKITMYPMVITELVSLRVLLLTGIHEATFNKQFRNLTSLKTIDFSSVSVCEYCNIKVIETEMFYNLPFIETLNLKCCQLQRIENGSLKQLQRLQNLDLSNNYFLNFKVFENISYDLQFTRIKTLNLECIHCSTGLGTIILRSDIAYIRNTTLERIILSHNRIQMFENYAMQEFPESLKVIDLSYNNLVPGLYVLELLRLRNIEVIYVKDQMSKHACGSLSPFQVCHDGGRHTKETEKLSFKNIGDNINISIGHKLRELHASYVGIFTFPEGDGSSFSFQKNNSLEYFDLSHNKLNGLTDPFSNLNKLHYLNLSNNGMVNISRKFLQELSNLITLNLSSNFLGLELSADKNGLLFSHHPKLKVLDVSNNGLGELPRYFFRGLKNIETLLIRANALSTWETKIGHLKKLKYIDLSQNKLSFLEKRAMSDINKILTHSNMTVNLLDNSLQCTCKTLTFLQWLTNHRGAFYNFEKYTCDYKQKRQKFKDLTDIILDLERNCNNYIGLILIVLLGVFLSLALVISGIIYRYRWKIRYFYYVTKQKYRQSADVAIHQDYDYDAFISYADEDSNYAIEIAETLENKFQLKFIMHQRDFLAGESIADNIAKAVRKARKTVILLSKKFLKSYWCMFEFNMARMESIYSRDGGEVLLIVMLERIRPKAIPLMMMDVLQSDSYIKCPKKNENKEVFWDKLQQAISME